MKTLLAVAALSIAMLMPAKADITCVVNAPDGELNLRENTTRGPGKVIGIVKNGQSISVLEVFRFDGKPWARVAVVGTNTSIGWMHRDYLNCQQASRSQQPPQQTEPSRGPTLGKDLARRCNSKSREEIMFCDGFIAAVYQMTYALKESSEASLACIPERASSVDMWNIAEIFMRRNPESYEWPAAMVITVAAAKQYGTRCPKS
jgi:hypothetical protein